MPKSEKTIIEANPLSITDSTNTNLIRRLSGIDVVLGMQENNRRGLLYIPYSESRELGEQIYESHSNIYDLQSQFANPRVIIVGFSNPQVDYNDMIAHLSQRFSQFPMFIDQRNKTKDGPIPEKEIIMTSRLFRVIPYNTKGNWDLNELIQLHYSKIK